MEYQNQRGGIVALYEYPRLTKQQWASGLHAMQAALDLEKVVHQALQDLHTKATMYRDAQFAHFLETKYLVRQVDEIKRLADYVEWLQQTPTNVGEYLFDKYVLQN